VAGGGAIHQTQLETPGILNALADTSEERIRSRRLLSDGPNTTTAHGRLTLTTLYEARWIRTLAGPWPGPAKAETSIMTMGKVGERPSADAASHYGNG
jgi:hypothetical protein